MAGRPAGDERREERLVGLVVESVEARDRTVSKIVIIPATRPFRADDDLLRAPPDGIEGASSKVDPLEWYAGEPVVAAVA